jgi:hypothetical protein
MSATRTQLLANILEVSKDMLATARENDWQRVVELEARRARMVRDCFASPTPEQDAPQVAAAISEILHLNQQVAQLGGQWKQRLGTEIRNRKAARTASAAYLSNAG